MWNFRKVIKTGDSRYLYTHIKNESDILPKNHPDYKIFKDIFWKYIKARGLSYNMRIKLQIEARIAILEYEQTFEGKNNEIRIDLAKDQLKDFTKEIAESSDYENDAVLSKFMGVNIDPKTHTIAQYVGFEKLLQKTNEEIKKQNGSNKRK